MSGIITRIVSEGSHISRHFLGVRSAPLKEYSAGFKVKARLKLRCRSCYFVRVDGRLHVECNEHGRHRQREIFDVKALW
uniref:Ribosomal protein n=1 Tax=Heterorhabditis bacteriophora TaxID=37862 RepID=A0A1I7XTY4_HETBA